jgi:hypothetical protein
VLDMGFAPLSDNNEDRMSDIQVQPESAVFDMGLHPLSDNDRSPTAVPSPQLEALGLGFGLRPSPDPVSDAPNHLAVTRPAGNSGMSIGLLYSYFQFCQLYFTGRQAS